MLSNLYIQNIVLIDVIDVNFDKGFCVLTGETGAGKSILLDALGLAIGKRASASLVRSGEEKGMVSASFIVKSKNKIFNLLHDKDIEAKDEIILRRVIHKDGKSKAYINDTPVSINFLQEVSKNLIEINGQNDQGELLNTKNHISLLDKYFKLDDLLSQLKNEFIEYKKLTSQLEELSSSQVSAKNDEEYLKFVINEIEEIEPQKGLEESLRSQRSVLSNKENLINSINESISLIENSNIVSSLNKSSTNLDSVADLNENLKKISATINSASIDVEDAVAQLNFEISNINNEENNLEEIEEKLFSLRSIAKKHNIHSDELLDFKITLENKLSKITNSDQIIKDLRHKLSVQKDKYLRLAEEISKARFNSKDEFEKKIHDELKPLKMENTSIKVDIKRKSEDKWSENGIDNIEFLVRTNPTSNYGSIKRIASGGELSRLMLTIKLILSDFNTIPTIIFDEIDTGTGGSVSESIGKRLLMLGKYIQVFAITHLPQVASKGSQNFKVLKTKKGETLNTNLLLLNEAEKLEEIARMIAGDKITNEARSAAKALIIS